MELSVVIPAFNREWSLRGTIDSVLACGVEAEIIVVDDGSTDKTWPVLQELQQRVPALRPVQNTGDPTNPFSPQCCEDGRPHATE